jgi:hypothetical protein
MKQPLYAAPEARLFFISAEDAGKIFNLDHKCGKGETKSGRKVADGFRVSRMYA